LYNSFCEDVNAISLLPHLQHSPTGLQKPLHSPPKNPIAVSVFSSPFCVTFLRARAKKQDPNKKQRKKAQIMVMTNKKFTVSRQCFGVHTVGKKKKKQQQQERET
jgi:hypothetical protein